MNSNMSVESKPAMSQLHLPNNILCELYTIHPITHVGMYMRRLMTTKLNQNVLWSVNSYVTGCPTEAFGNTCVVLTEDFGGLVVVRCP